MYMCLYVCSPDLLIIYNNPAPASPLKLGLQVSVTTPGFGMAVMCSIHQERTVRWTFVPLKSAWCIHTQWEPTSVCLGALKAAEWRSFCGTKSGELSPEHS